MAPHGATKYLRAGIALQPCKDPLEQSEPVSQQHELLKADRTPLVLRARNLAVAKAAVAIAEEAPPAINGHPFHGLKANILK